jgi:hypothetical protein
VTGVSGNNRNSPKIPDLKSAHHPVADFDKSLVPFCIEILDGSEHCFSVYQVSEEKVVVLDNDAPHPFTQMRLNDLVYN